MLLFRISIRHLALRLDRSKLSQVSSLQHAYRLFLVFHPLSSQTRATVWSKLTFFAKAKTQQSVLRELHKFIVNVRLPSLSPSRVPLTTSSN